jgi:hypothetical protein
MEEVVKDRIGEIGQIGEPALPKSAKKKHESTYLNLAPISGREPQERDLPKEE